MAFITGSITNANPGPTLYALIETAALGIGWTLDDTVTIGGNTHKVLKSAAAGNTYGLDWFLDINFPTTGITGGMRFAPFEGYTAASDVGLRGPFGHVGITTTDATTYSRYGATTSALETNWTNSASASALSATLATTAFVYWVSITRDRIVMMTSLQVDSMFYTGFFTPTTLHATHAGAALFPLVMAKLANIAVASSGGSIATATAAVTRAPKAAAQNWSTSVRVTAEQSAVGWTTQAAVGVANSEYTGITQIIPLPVYFGGTVTSNATTLAHVGYLNGIAYGWTVGTAIRGDYATVGADTWYTTTPTNGQSLYMAGV